MRRRGFTLVELMVAIALATMLVGVLAATFAYVTRAQDQSLARLDATRDVAAALELFERDWARAVAAPQAGAFQVSLASPSVVVDWDATPRTLRHDAVEMLVLEATDPDGDGVRDFARLIRVRWELRWDASKEEGRIVRMVAPATVPGVSIPTITPAEADEEVVLSPVVEMRALPWMGDRFEDPPPAAGVALWCEQFIHTGSDASIVAFDLRTTATRFDHLGPGSVVRLEDAGAGGRFDEGLYAVRLRQLIAPPSSEARLVLARPPGDATGNVRYTATWLPQAMFLAIDVKVRDSRALVIRRLGRVVARSSVDAALLGSGP